ncbi:MAG: hypothetical protein D3906_00285 [Candidatus Electrothrix sp. AUS1_2]|nr:hypothetical protein [Candidatus Electrothrix sp. AUS1_2]
MFIKNQEWKAGNSLKSGNLYSRRYSSLDLFLNNFRVRKNDHLKNEKWACELIWEQVYSKRTIG